MGIHSGATAIKYSATGNRSNIHFCECRDIDINNVYRGIHLYVCTGGVNKLAWMNTISFNNIIMRAPVIGVDFDTGYSRNNGPYVQSGGILDSCRFTKVQMQCGGRTTDGFKKKPKSKRK